MKGILHCACALAALALGLSAAHGAEPEEGIEVGGAVRLQMSLEGYDAGNRDRYGDFDLDTIRLNFEGSIDEVLLSAEWRYYQYMQVIHHGWVGYDFTETLRGELGITKVPFGNLPFNSHNFFFSSNYYLGLEDDYDAGIKFTWLPGPWDLRLAFFKNDEQGGVDGYVDDRTERYSYDVIAEGLEATGGLADEIGESNTLVGRAAYVFGTDQDTAVEVGLSALAGQLRDGDGSRGHYTAFAPHLNGEIGRWNLQLQVARYDYAPDSGADVLVVGAYAFPDRIPASATSWTANLAYRLPVNLGPITAVTFYSDNSLVTDKSGGLEDTVMNVLGASIEAGPVFAYLDFVSARNQPFIGGSTAGDSDDREQRVNLNIGYYF